MFRQKVYLAAVSLLALSLGKVAFAELAAPVVHEKTLTAKLPYPYDESADAHMQIEAALKRAAFEHKFVLIDFGGNWCPDCRVTAGVLGLDDVKPWVKDTFELVYVDIGRLNKNMDIGEHFNLRIKAVPTIVVLNSQGRMINTGNPAALQDAREMSPQAIVDTIYGWTRQPG